MKGQIIITIVVAVVLGAHVWLFMWIKFKIDEGTILKFLNEFDDKSGSSVETIVANTRIAQDRVATVCTHSKMIKRHTMEKELWCLK
jgi:hypothetical protein